MRVRRGDARLAALVRVRAVALGVALCVVVGVVGVVVPDDDDGRGAGVAVRRRWCYPWPVHAATDTHRLTPVVGREVGARGLDRIRRQGRAEVELLNNIVRS